MAVTQAPAFAAWLDEFFTSYYRHRPVNATFIGVHAHDDRFPDFSEHKVGDVAAEMETLLRRLQELPPEVLTETESLDRKLAEGFLRIQLWEYGSSHFHRGNPCVYTGEAVFGVIGLFLRPFAPISERVEAAVARMASIPALLRQGRENIRRAPAAWIARAIRECDGALAFFEDGIDCLIQDHAITDARVRRSADAAIVAFGGFRQYLDVDLRGRATADYKCGSEALGLLLRHGHFLDKDASTIAAEARERIAVYTAHLQARARESGAWTWRDTLAQLADRYPPVEAYYGRYMALWEASRAAASGHDLVTWPDFPIKYVPQPTWARKAAPHLYFLPYRSPAPYDPFSVVEYLVPPIEPEMPSSEQTRLLRTTNDSVIKLNHVIHHGGFGHHLQNWYASRAASCIGRVAAVDCASRIAMFCGGTMAEGWACYATDLMDEIGFLDPLEHYAQQHARLRLAARALVDVSLHLGVFTLDDATNFYQDSVGMTSEAAYAEAVKNSMFPGTALMYLVGNQHIHELRKELSAQVAAFDLRRFHDHFLSFGSVPVTLVSAAMRQRLVHGKLEVSDVAIEGGERSAPKI